MTVADNYHLSSTNQKSTFLQSIFNSINILLGVGILALPLGFKVSNSPLFFNQTNSFGFRVQVGSLDS